MADFAAHQAEKRLREAQGMQFSCVHRYQQKTCGCNPDRGVYHFMLKGFLKSFHKHPKDITWHAARSHLVALRKRNAPENPDYLEAVASLKFFFNDVMQSIGPALKDFTSATSSERLPLSRKSLEFIISKVPSLKHRLILRLNVIHGLPVSQIKTLRQDQIDFKRGLLFLEHATPAPGNILHLPPNALNDFKEVISGSGQSFPAPAAYLFPGKTPGSCMSSRMAGLIVKWHMRRVEKGRTADPAEQLRSAV